MSHDIFFENFVNIFLKRTGILMNRNKKKNQINSSFVTIFFRCVVASTFCLDGGDEDDDKLLFLCDDASSF